MTEDHQDGEGRSASRRPRRWLLLLTPAAFGVVGVVHLSQHLAPASLYEFERTLESVRDGFLLAAPLVALLLGVSRTKSQGVGVARPSMTFIELALLLATVLGALYLLCPFGEAASATYGESELEFWLLVGGSLGYASMLIFVTSAASASGRRWYVSLGWGVLWGGFWLLLPMTIYDLWLKSLDPATAAFDVGGIANDVSAGLGIVFVGGPALGAMGVLFLLERRPGWTWKRWLLVATAAHLLGPIVVIGLLGALVFAMNVESIDEAEVERAESWIDGAIEENNERQCSRPVLHGVATAGSGSEQLFELIDPEGPFSNCLEAADRDRTGKVMRGYPNGPQSKKRWRFADVPESEPGEGDPEPPILLKRWMLTAFGVPPYTDEERPESMKRVLHSCSELPAAVSVVVSHEDVCSPWLPGVRPMSDESPIHMVRLARAITIIAHHRASQGNDDGALRLLLDGARLFMDARRGPVSTLTALSADIGEGVIFSELQTLLSMERFSPTALEQVQAELELLAQTAPRVGEVLRGEPVHLALYSIMPGIREDWSPPGGWDQSSFLELPPRGELARASLVAVFLTFLETCELCSENDDALTCLHALREMGRAPLPERNWDMGRSSWLLQRLDMDYSLGLVRQQTTDMYDQLFPSLAAMPARPRALAAIIAFRRAGGECPRESDRTFQGQEHLLEAAELGAPLWIRPFPIREGVMTEIEVQAPLSVAGVTEEEGFPGLLPLVRVLCPPVSSLGEWVDVPADTDASDGSDSSADGGVSTESDGDVLLDGDADADG